MLLILQCLLSTNGHLIPEQFAFRLKEWTEIGFPELGNKACCGVGFTVGSVIGHPEFVANPHKAAFDVWESKGCDLAANGAVMRTSVLGIPLFFNESQVVLNSINCAKVTHADPRCIFSAVVVSVLISRILRKELQIGDKYEMNDSDRERLLKCAESKTTNFNSNEGSFSKSNPDLLLSDVCKPKTIEIAKPQNASQTFWARLVNLGKKSDNKTPSWWPSHKDTDPLRLQTPAKCSSDPNRFSTSLCGQDDPMMALIEDVVSDYKFLINIKKESTVWNADVERLCFPKHLQELQLDEKSSIGYTLKCLGAALFCVSRRKDDDMENGDFFMRIITELTLEAGDADTNAAVAGALLGSRLGFKGLPSMWLMGLRNHQFLINICDELLELVMKQLLIES